MYSYFNIQREKLNPEQMGTYQSYYCGLCLKLKEKYGNRGRILLRKDMTFLIMLLSSLYGEGTGTQDFYCPKHPGGRKKCCTSEATSYVAAMTIALSVCRKRGKTALDKRMPEIREAYPRQTEAIENGFRKLEKLKKTEESSIEVYQSVYGEILGELFAWKEDEWYDEMKCLGYHLGRFICMMSAYEDRKRKAYENSENPFSVMYRENADRFESLMSLMMHSMIDECKRSFCRLDLRQNRDILYHILNEGVWVRYTFLQKKGRKQKARASKEIMPGKDDER